MQTTLDNVNFQILLKQHGGNFAQAKKAWDRICHLGGFGNVPVTYEGGLDVKGMRITQDEISQGEIRALQFDPNARQAIPRQVSPTLADDIKRIEDLASGDKA